MNVGSRTSAIPRIWDRRSHLRSRKYLDGRVRFPILTILRTPVPSAVSALGPPVPKAVQKYLITSFIDFFFHFETTFRLIFYDCINGSDIIGTWKMWKSAKISSNTANADTFSQTFCRPKTGAPVPVAVPKLGTVVPLAFPIILGPPVPALSCFWYHRSFGNAGPRLWPVITKIVLVPLHLSFFPYKTLKIIET